MPINHKSPFLNSSEWLLEWLSDLLFHAIVPASGIRQTRLVKPLYGIGFSGIEGTTTVNCGDTLTPRKVYQPMIPAKACYQPYCGSQAQVNTAVRVLRLIIAH